MRYLFLVMAAMLVVCSGKNPVNVQKEYYFSGQTLIKVDFKDLKMDSVKFTRYPSSAWEYGFLCEYRIPLPSDFGYDYIISLPVVSYYPYSDTTIYKSTDCPVSFFNASDTSFSADGRAKISNDGTSIIYSCRFACLSSAASDSATAIQFCKNYLNKSWFTYSIQKAVDLDSL